MELGDQFLSEGNYAQAIRCFRLVLPREILIRTQTIRLEHLKEIVAERAPLARSVGKVFWVEYYQKLISRVESQLKGLTNSPDYTPSLRLRQAQAYLLNKRYHEAWLLCEHLATSPHLTAAQTEEAHYRWIFAASGLEKWEDALSIAKSFLERYPTSPQAPEAFYLISQAHLEQRRYAQAIEVFDEIIEHFPNHPMRERSLFTRGFAQTLLEKFPEARSDFNLYNNEFPQGHFNVNSLLWHALTFFFERQYDQALEELSILEDTRKEHPLYPEILYRKGVTHYAKRQYDFAQTTIENFTQNFSLHPRFSEALILLGDIRMGQGQLHEAMRAYAEISQENRPLFTYAAFQTGKILRVQENYTDLVSHFIHYIKEKEQAPPVRISEALYWIGWAYIQLDQPQEALPHFNGILDHYGNNPESTEIDSTLSALHKLFAQQTPPISFNDWLETHRQIALERTQLTYFSRLTLFLSNREKQTEADSLIEQLVTAVSIAQLDALGLGKIGQWLYERDPEKAYVYFETLVTNFPQSPHRATAFYGLAQYSYAADNYPEALKWLNKFNSETPGHQLSVQASLLTGKTFLAIGKATDATTQFEKVLQLKAGRGRRHAEALKGLAEAALQLEKDAKAIAYYQRIYTLYRAYSDLVSEAYLKSGLLFEKLGDLQAAKRTFDEMLANPRLQEATQKEEAVKALKRIVLLLPQTSPTSTIQ
jgi:outer membrane protein assembly factor BamD (BamD/ComL family)